MLISRRSLRNVLVLVSLDRIRDSLCCTSGCSMTWTLPAIAARKVPPAVRSAVQRDLARRRVDGGADGGGTEHRRERDEAREQQVARAAVALALFDRCEAVGHDDDSFSNGGSVFNRRARSNPRRRA